MANGKIRVAVATLAASAMLFTSSAALASAPSSAAQPSPWAVLSVMSGGAAAMQACGAAAATAAQPTGGCVLPQTDVPPPVAQAPVEALPVAAAPAVGVSPLLLALAAIAAGVGLYYALRANRIRVPNSPA